MSFLLHIIIVACITLFPVLGYNIVFGKGKILHFGQEAFSLIAIYVLWVLVMQYDIHFFPAIIASAIAVTVTALFFAWLSFRLEPDGLGVMSIAVHLITLAVVLNWQSVTRGALGIPKIPRAPFPVSIEGFALFVLALAVLWILFLLWIDRGSFGRGLAALSEHEWHAESLGIQRKKLHLFAFLIAAAGSLLSGTLFPAYIFLVSPSNYTFPVMIFFVMCVVAGGPGRVWGVTLATFALVFLREGLRFVALPPDMLGPVRLMLFGMILFAAVWWRRDTLFPKQRRV